MRYSLTWTVCDTGASGVTPIVINDFQDIAGNSTDPNPDSDLSRRYVMYSSIVCWYDF